MTVGHSNTNNLSSPSNMGQAEILLASGGVSSILSPSDVTQYDIDLAPGGVSSISSVAGAATIVGEDGNKVEYLGTPPSVTLEHAGMSEPYVFLFYGTAPANLVPTGITEDIPRLFVDGSNLLKSGGKWDLSRTYSGGATDDIAGSETGLEPDLDSPITAMGNVQNLQTPLIAEQFSITIPATNLGLNIISPNVGKWVGQDGLPLLFTGVSDDRAIAEHIREDDDEEEVVSTTQIWF